jgi:hypothetical protein
MEEIWKEIGFTNGDFSISNYGRVRNEKTQRISFGSNSGDSYRRFTFKNKKYRIHRLVAEAFIPKTKNSKNFVKHRDSTIEGKLNNHVSNLFWANPFISSIMRKNVVREINGKFTANVTINKKHYSFGSFENLQQARIISSKIRELIIDLSL